MKAGAGAVLGLVLFTLLAAFALQSVKRTYPPLLVAAGQGSLEAVTELLADGANPNQTDHHGRSALHFACGVPLPAEVVLDNGYAPHPDWPGGGRPDPILMNALLEAGADAELRTAWNSSPIETVQGPAEAFDVLLRHGYNAAEYPGKLHTAIQLGDVEATMWLMKHGATPTSVYFAEGEFTPLMSAAWPLYVGRNKRRPPEHDYGYIADPVKTMDLLVQNGAAINEAGYEGNTALHCAAWAAALNVRCDQRAMETIRWLIDRGADMTIRNQHGRTPLEEFDWLRTEQAKEMVGSKPILGQDCVPEMRSLITQALPKTN